MTEIRICWAFDHNTKEYLEESLVGSVTYEDGTVDYQLQKWQTIVPPIEYNPEIEKLYFDQENNIWIKQ